MRQQTLDTAPVVSCPYMCPLPGWPATLAAMSCGRDMSAFTASTGRLSRCSISCSAKAL